MGHFFSFLGETLQHSPQHSTTHNRNEAPSADRAY